MILRTEGDRFIYAGEDVIIFPETCVPNYKNAFMSSDMRGAIIEFIEDFSNDTKGSRGLIWFSTDGFWHIISENRHLSRIHHKERKQYIKLIGVYPPAQHYDAGVVDGITDKILKDFEDGKFKFF